MTHPKDLSMLAGDLAEHSRRAITQTTLERALVPVVDLVIEAQLADFAGVTQRHADGIYETTAPTAPLVIHADQLQYKLNEGPCVQTAEGADMVASTDVAVDTRWPRWGPAARRLGICSVLSVELYTDKNAIGALNLYSTAKRTYGDQEVELARLIGAHASVALAHFRGAAHLWKAVDSRHRIGIAQGILMQQLHISAEQAFSYLRRRSQQDNIKLHLLADAIIRDRDSGSPANRDGESPIAGPEGSDR